MSAGSIVQDLPATVLKRLVAKGPTREHRVKMLTAHALPQKACARIDAQLVDLEIFHESQLFGAELAQAGKPLRSGHCSQGVT